MFWEIDREKEIKLDIYPIAIAFEENQVKIVRPQGHTVHQFIWVTEGEGVFETSKGARTLIKGQGLFTRKGEPHSYRSAVSHMSTMWVTFSGGEKLLDYYGVGEMFYFDVPSIMEDGAYELANICLSATSKAVRSSHMYSFLVNILENLFVPPLTLSNKITAYLEHNAHKPITLDELSNEFKTDKYTLCRSFLKESGTTIMQMLKNLRLKKAKNLLRYSSYPISEIGIACGFESASYFIKTFREAEGITPLVYRNENSGGTNYVSQNEKI